MDLTGKIRRNDAIVYREEEEGAFLFDPDTGNLKYMNSTGKEVFQLLTGERDVGQVVEALSLFYPEMESDALQSDVEKFLDELTEDGFVTQDGAR